MQIWSHTNNSTVAIRLTSSEVSNARLSIPIPEGMVASVGRTDVLRTLFAGPCLHITVLRFDFQLQKMLNTFFFVPRRGHHKRDYPLSQSPRWYAVDKDESAASTTKCSSLQLSY